MQITRHTYYYFVGLLLFVVLKFMFSALGNDAFVFLTKPTSKIISIVTNSTFIYSSNAGFYFENLNIIIDKSCSGFNFWLLCFIMILFSFLKYLQSHLKKLLAFPCILLIAYCITLFVNTSRILISLLIENTLHLEYKWLHQTEGVFIYLSFLMLLYLTINHLQTKYLKYYEKLT